MIVSAYSAWLLWVFVANWILAGTAEGALHCRLLTARHVAAVSVQHSEATLPPFLQVMTAVSAACRRAVQEADPRLVEAMYLCQVSSGCTKGRPQAGGGNMPGK